MLLLNSMVEFDPLLVEVPERLATERLWLRRLRRGDGESMHRAALESQNELAQWFPWANRLSLSDGMEEFIARQVELWDSRVEFNYRVERHGDDECLGSVGFVRTIWPLRALEIGYWLSTRATGHGFMSEAVSAITHMGFDKLNAQRIYIRCKVDNVKSRAVAERCGFHFEGIIRSEILNPSGAFSDVAYYSMVGDERPGAIRRG